ncbi:MAG: DUF401 family protein [Clostridia bacterium]|nr:DUF401 family protein [Clostridia bacterium]
MNILIVKLIILFAVLVALMKFKVKLAKAMAITVLFSLFLFNFGVNGSIELLKDSTFSFSTFSLVAVVYVIFLLQGMLDKRNQLKLAQENLNALFNNRRINAAVAPIFIGLLPSAAAVTICGEIVRDSVKDDIPREEQAFITNFFRHIPESFLPTYTSIILMCSLSGVQPASFVIGMAPMAALSFILGYIFYIRKIGKDTGLPPCKNKTAEVKGLFQHLWALLLIIVLVLAFKRTVLFSEVLAIVLMLFVYKFKPSEMPELLKKAFNGNVLASTYLIMVLKSVLKMSGVTDELPKVLSSIPVPAFLIFAALFFISPFVVGSDATSAMFTSMAYAAIPGSGMPLAVLLNTFSYIAMNFSPTHICIHIVSEDYGVPFGEITKRMIPIAVLMAAGAIGYYLLLTAIL